MLVPGIPYIKGVSDHGTSTKYGIIIHCTDNLASARDEAIYATRRTDGIGAHFYADKTEVIQSLDTVVKTWQTGNVGNTVGIGVEIVGLAEWARDRWLASVDFVKLGKVLAVVARAHGIPPQWLTVAQLKASSQTKGFYTHNDTRLAWGGTTHTDPGPGFPKDVLLGEVKKALTPTPTPTDWTVALIMALPTIKRGATGQLVKNLQGLLRAHGHGIAIDGIFGPATESAVRDFQRAHHLTIDGIVGRQTWTALITK